MTMTITNKDEGVQSAPRWAWGGFLATLIILIIVGVVRSYDGNNDTDNAETQHTMSGSEMLVLQHECHTPCSTDIRWRAQIWGDGPDFWVHFPGVTDPILFGRGKFTAPEGVEVGETFFRAADPNEPVLIRVYKKVRVR